MGGGRREERKLRPWRKLVKCTDTQHFFEFLEGVAGLRILDFGFSILDWRGGNRRVAKVAKG